MADVDAYPLTWPAHVPRTPRHKIYSSQFKVTPGVARDEMFDELSRLGARKIVVSTNVPIRRDGRSYANPPRLTDAGVAVYFTRKDMDQCIALDRYPTIGENMRGIGKTIEAIRGIERWGTSQMVDAAFRGFAALPETTGGDAWWDVLGLIPNATRDQIDAAWKRLVKQHHPDTGGDADTFRRITQAYEHAISGLT